MRLIVLIFSLLLLCFLEEKVDGFKFEGVITIEWPMEEDILGSSFRLTIRIEILLFLIG